MDNRCFNRIVILFDKNTLLTKSVLQKYLPIVQRWMVTLNNNLNKYFGHLYHIPSNLKLSRPLKARLTDGILLYLF